MPDRILPRRFPRGQIDKYPLLSLSYNDANPNGPVESDELFPEGATISATLQTRQIQEQSDRLQFPDVEPWKGEDLAPESSPYYELQHGAHVVRLVKVLHGTTSSTVSCKLTTYSLDQAPDYTALSYTWGRPDPDCDITLNGVHVPTRKNLWRFLREVRNNVADRDKLYWIDALCIDQQNLAERTHQVGLMSEIYTQAKDVLVWLGPSYGDSDLALQVLSRWASTADMSNGEVAKIWWRPHGAALRRLCERPYWSRLWVLQEMVLAKIVILACGSRRAPGTALSKFLLRARTIPPTTHRDENHEYDPTMQSRAMSILQQMQRARNKPSLLDQMRVSQHLRCHEPRDKVYALLGIVGRGHEGIAPDYQIGLPSLLNAVLRNHHKHRPMKDLLNIKRQCQELCEAVGVSPATIFRLEDQVDRKAPSHQDAARTRLIDHESGLTLWWACLYGHQGVAELLLAKIGRRLFNDHVVESVREGNLSLVRFWLTTGLGIIECVDNLGRNLVTVATAHGHAEIVRTLLKQSNIDVNAPDRSGKMAIHWAVSNGLTEVLKVLLAHSSTDVNIFDKELCTPLRLAMKLDRRYCLQLLLGRPDLNMNLASEKFRTPLEYAMSRKQADVVAMLLEREDLEVTPSRWKFTWCSPLHESIRTRDDHTFNMLMARRDMNANFVDEHGSPALHVALSTGNEHAITTLLNRPDIDLGSQDMNGDGPLHLAVRSKHNLLVIELLRLYCSLRKFPASFRLLSARVADLIGGEGRVRLEWQYILPTVETQDYGNPVASNWLTGPRATSGTTDQPMPLCYPVNFQHFLPGTRLDINLQNEEGCAPLHVAIIEANNNAVSLLVCMPGIDVNIRDHNGVTPLYMAADAGNEAILKLLLLHKNIDVNIKRHSGLSAIYIARRNGHTGVVKLLADFILSGGKSIHADDCNLLDLAWHTWDNDALSQEWEDVEPEDESPQKWMDVAKPGFVEPSTSPDKDAILDWFREGHFGVPRYQKPPVWVRRAT